MNDIRFGTVRNNCRACEYYELSPKEAGHCYMFKIEPMGICAQFKGPETPCGQVSNGIACETMRAGIQKLCPDCNPWRPQHAG